MRREGGPREGGRDGGSGGGARRSDSSWARPPAPVTASAYSRAQPLAFKALELQEGEGNRMAEMVVLGRARLGSPGKGPGDAPAPAL